MSRYPLPPNRPVCGGTDALVGFGVVAKMDALGFGTVGKGSADEVLVDRLGEEWAERGGQSANRFEASPEGPVGVLLVLVFFGFPISIT